MSNLTKKKILNESYFRVEVHFIAYNMKKGQKALPQPVMCEGSTVSMPPVSSPYIDSLCKAGHESKGPGSCRRAKTGGRGCRWVQAIDGDMEKQNQRRKVIDISSGKALHEEKDWNIDNLSLVVICSRRPQAK